MEVYVKLTEDGKVDAICTSRLMDFAPVECDTGSINMDRLDGYSVKPNEKGINSLVYDENAYLKAKAEKEALEAKTKAENLYRTLMKDLVLKSATDEQALLLKPLYPVYDPTHSYEVNDRCIIDGKLHVFSTSKQWICLET